MITPEIVEQYFPKAVQWSTEMEKAILECGQRLLPQNRKDAEAIGIQRVGDVRIVVLDRIPLPNDPGLQQLALGTGLITGGTAGMTFGHGVVLKNGSYDRRLIAHELGHVMQYERFGGIESFLKEYIKEIAFPPGYPNGPLEREADLLAELVVQNPWMGGFLRDRTTTPLLMRPGRGPLRVPMQLAADLIFENYDDSEFGYLRIVANNDTLRMEFHAVGPSADKAGVDALTVDLKSHTMISN